MATRSSILTWKIPWTEESRGLQSVGSQRVRHDWAHNSIKSYPGKMTPSDRSTRVKRKEVRNQMFSFHIPLCSAGGNMQTFQRATWWYVSKCSLAAQLSLWLKGWGKARQKVAGKRQGREDGRLDRKWGEAETWERILHPHVLSELFQRQLMPWPQALRLSSLPGEKLWAIKHLGRNPGGANTGCLLVISRGWK